MTRKSEVKKKTKCPESESKQRHVARFEFQFLYSTHWKSFQRISLENMRSYGVEEINAPESPFKDNVFDAVIG